MANLHTINFSTFTDNTATTIFGRVSANDGIVFLEDGVYNVVTSSPIAVQLNNALQSKVNIYFLEADATARGCHGKMAQGALAIDFAEFVRLTTEYDRTISWF